MKEVKDIKQRNNLLLVSIVGILAAVLLIFVFSNSMQKPVQKQDIVGDASLRPRCIDSDSGAIYDKRGRTCRGASCLTDYCKDAYTLIEYNCSTTGSRLSTIHNCQVSCRKGACESRAASPTYTSETYPQYAHIEIVHTFIGDLVATLGVGKPDNPKCYIKISDRQGGTTDNIIGNVDLTSCASYLPPSASNLWFLDVSDKALGDEGSLEAFTINDNGKTYNPFGLPMPIKDLSRVTAFITPFKNPDNAYIFLTRLSHFSL